MNTDRRRPFFSRFWLCVSPSMDSGGMRDFRRQLLAELDGEVVEVGSGNSCHASRDTAAAIAGAGFSIEHIERFRFPQRGFSPTWPHIIGVAVRT